MKNLKRTAAFAVCLMIAASVCAPSFTAYAEDDIVVIGYDDEVIKNEEELEISDLKNGDYVAVLGHNHIFCSIRILLDRIAVNTSINEKEILCFMNKFKNAKKVVLPHELRQQLVFFKTSDNRIKEKIRTVLDSNEIEYPFIALMEGVLNGKH